MVNPTAPASPGPEKAPRVPQATDPAPVVLCPGAIPVGHSPGTPPPVKVSFVIEKNAKVGEAYRSGIQASGSRVEILGVAVPDELGVAYDPVSGQLQGTPAIHGDYVLTVGYRLIEADPGRPPALEAECTLIVNPDPRKLWQENPSDRNDPDWKADVDMKYLQGADGRRLVASSKRGRSHAHVGSFRDDDFFLDTASGWNILAVADGAGSAKNSRRGSQIVTRRAGDSLKLAVGDERGRKFAEAAARWAAEPSSSPHAVHLTVYDILGAAAFDAMKAVEDEAKAKENPVKEYATTLILGVHKKLPCGHLVAAYWVGDGAIALYRRGLDIELLGVPDSGEFAGQTRFLDRAMVSSGDEIMKRLCFSVVPDFTALVLMTDGISDPKFETDRNLADLGRWDTFWGEIEPLLRDDTPGDRLLDWLDFWSQGNHDDRTIAVLW